MAVRQSAVEGLAMKILITGNLGYVGPGVTEQLRSTYPGVSLVGLDMGFFGHVLTGTDRLPV